jgi:hypothetical protein
LLVSILGGIVFAIMTHMFVHLFVKQLCLFVFYCHCLYHHLWLVISMVCLGNVVVKGNKLWLIGDVFACSFVICFWNHYFYHVAFGWWS